MVKKSVKILVFTLVSVTWISGCVSKKKFTEMETQKNKFQKQARELTSEKKSLEGDLESARKDFEGMKNELHYSNTLKDDEVDLMKIKIKELSRSTEDLSGQLDELKKLYQNQRNSNMMSTSELEKLKQTRLQLQRDTASLRYSLDLAKERSQMLQKAIEERTQTISQQYRENETLKKQNQVEAKKVKQMEGQLVRSKQNLERVSKEFIELRRQMLSAKSKGTPIDPNSNKHVDTISKALGHY